MGGVMLMGSEEASGVSGVDVFGRYLPADAASLLGVWIGGRPVPCVGLVSAGHLKLFPSAGAGLDVPLRIGTSYGTSAASAEAVVSFARSAPSGVPGAVLAWRERGSDPSRTDPLAVRWTFEASRSFEAAPTGFEVEARPVGWESREEEPLRFEVALEDLDRVQPQNASATVLRASLRGIPEAPPAVVRVRALSAEGAGPWSPLMGPVPASCGFSEHLATDRAVAQWTCVACDVSVVQCEGAPRSWWPLRAGTDASGRAGSPRARSRRRACLRASRGAAWARLSRRA